MERECLSPLEPVGGNPSRGQRHDPADNRTGGVAVAASSNSPPHGLFEVVQVVGGTPEAERYGVLGSDVVTSPESFDSLPETVAWHVEALHDSAPGQAL